MYYIIVNPIAGKGNSLNALKTVETILIGKKIKYEVLRTTHPGHASELADEICHKDADDSIIIAMGGDGTFNEVLNGISDFSKITLGFISCGTGNDYVKATKIPMDVKGALNLILQGNIGYTDFIQMSNRRALNCTGAGMDVDILLKYASMKFFKGKIKYYASLIYTLLHLRFHKMRITLDGKSMDKSVFLMVVANGIYIGGGMPISPESIVDDGKFNIVIVNEVKKRRVLGLLIKFLKGKHLSDKATETYLGEEVKIDLLDNGATQVDGEVFENKVMDCKLIHNTLKTFK